MNTGVDVGDPALLQRWFPLCAAADLPPRHVLEVELLGRELALWQGSDGRPNVWENRCPHRGLRLTLGANLGETLRCAYHGYRFGTGSGRCTLVPAEPGRAPPASLRVVTYRALEREALIWTRLAGNDLPGELPPPGPRRRRSYSPTAAALYPIAIRAPVGRVAAALAQYRCRDAATCETTTLDPFCVESLTLRDGSREVVRLYLRPVDAGSTVIHGVLFGGPEAGPRLAALRHHAALLNALRREIESAEAGGAPAMTAARALRPALRPALTPTA